MCKKPSQLLDMLPDELLRKNGSKCAPARRLTNNNPFTCYTLDELQVMAQAVNDSLGQEAVPVTGNKMNMWKALHQAFQPTCQTETCWIDQTDVMSYIKKSNGPIYKRITQDVFKPRGKRKPREWLSTADIERVMRQYERVFPYFKFLGCVPSDHFRLHPDEVPRLPVRKYDCSALIFNVDETHQSGSHWVTVFFHHDNKGLSIEFFDSTGNAPTRNIKRFMELPAFQDATYKQSYAKHQKGNSECGVYAMYYILQRVVGRTMKDINRRRITDKEMNEYREVFFRPYQSF